MAFRVTPLTKYRLSIDLLQGGLKSPMFASKNELTKRTIRALQITQVTATAARSTFRPARRRQWRRTRDHTDGSILSDETHISQAAEKPPRHDVSQVYQGRSYRHQCQESESLRGIDSTSCCSGQNWSGLDTSHFESLRVGWVFFC